MTSIVPNRSRAVLMARAARAGSLASIAIRELAPPKGWVTADDPLTDTVANNTAAATAIVRSKSTSTCCRHSRRNRRRDHRITAREAGRPTLTGAPFRVHAVNDRHFVPRNALCR